MAEELCEACLSGSDVESFCAVCRNDHAVTHRDRGVNLERTRVLAAIREVRDDWRHCSAVWVLDRLAERIKAGNTETK